MRVGIAVAPVHTPRGVPLGGNVRADKATRETHDPVTVTVLALEHAGGRVLVVQVDLIGISSGLLVLVEKRLRDVIDLPMEIVLCATHTHSAPDVMRGFGFDDHDYSSVDAWEEEAAEVVLVTAVRALSDLAAAELRMSLGAVANVAFNRRILRADGSIRMNWDVAGARAGELAAEAADDEVVVVRMLVDGRTVGVLVHFALHPAILVGLGGAVSADYVHFLRRRVQEEVGVVPVLFLNGAMGDINHIAEDAQRRETGFAEAERVGVALGEAVGALLEADGEILTESMDLRRVRVPLRQRVPSAADLARARELIDNAAGRHADARDGIPALAYARWLVRRGALLDDHVEIDVTVLAIGRLVLVVLPFEVFVRFGLDLRRAHPEIVAKIVSLGGGPYLGYLPTGDAFDEGGYEPTFGTSTIERGEGERLLSVVDRIVAGTRSPSGAGGIR